MAHLTWKIIITACHRVIRNTRWTVFQNTCHCYVTIHGIFVGLDQFWNILGALPANNDRKICTLKGCHYLQSKLDTLAGIQGSLQSVLRVNSVFFLSTVFLWSVPIKDRCLWLEGRGCFVFILKSLALITQESWMQLIKAIWLDKCLRVLLITIRNYLLKNFNLNGNSQLEFFHRLKS